MDQQIVGKESCARIQIPWPVPNLPQIPGPSLRKLVMKLNENEMGLFQNNRFGFRAAAFRGVPYVHPTSIESACKADLSQWDYFQKVCGKSLQKNNINYDKTVGFTDRSC